MLFSNSGLSRLNPFSAISYAFGVISIFIVIFQFQLTASAQLSEVENTLPKSVPLKVEFKGYDQERWWYEMEIKVTNTGTKPIYYLSTSLFLDVVSERGNPLTVTFSFGDGERLFSAQGLASPSDPAILPGESYILKAVKGQADAWDLGHRTRVSKWAPTRGELRLTWINFGDGTSIEGGGTTIRKKAILDRKR